MARPSDAFHRRSGSVDPATGAYRPRGKPTAQAPRNIKPPERGVKVKAEMAAFDIETVRAHRRRHPHPPTPIRPKRRKTVKVSEYFRRQPGSELGPLNEAESTRAWVAYLADYYHVSQAEARRMERDSRP